MRFLILVSREIDERCKILNYVIPFIPNWADKEGGPEFAAILAAVLDFGTLIRAALKLGFDQRQSLGIGGVCH